MDWPVAYEKRNEGRAYGSAPIKTIDTHARYFLSKMGGIESTEPDAKTSLFGLNGEIIVKRGQTIEIWDWIPHPEQKMGSLDNVNGAKFDRRGKQRNLFLVGSITLHEPVSHIWPIKCNRQLYHYQLLCRGEDDQLFIRDSHERYFGLNIQIANCSVRVSKDWIVVANDESGELNLIDNKDFSVKQVMETQVRNNKAVFDIKGTWIAVLHPKRQLSKVIIANDKLIKKVLNTLSKTTIDSLVTISQVSRNKIQNALNRNTNYDRSYSELLSQWFNSITSDSDYITVYKITDLNSTKLIIQFPLATGCSKVSLSPNDMNLITISKRGDDILLWDFTFYDKHIVLHDKWVRGSTSGIIDEIFWSLSNSQIYLRTNGSGTVRCLNIDWNNYDNFKTIAKCSSTSKHPDWCLSNMKFQSCFLVSSILLSEFFCCISKAGDVLVVDSKGVKSCLKVPEIGDMEYPHTLSYKAYTYDIVRDPVKEMEIAREIEIETCKPFVPLYNDRRVKFAKFDSNYNLSSMGSDIKITEFKIAANAKEREVKIRINNTDLPSHSSDVDAEQMDLDLLKSNLTLGMSSTL